MEGKTPGMIRAATAGIIILSIGSYALSFERLYLAARSAGTPWELSIVYGLLLEGFVSLATYTAYVARGTKSARYPWIVAGAMFSFSLVANWNSSVIPPGLIRALPVLLVPVGVHMLIVLREAYRASLVAPEPTVITQTVEVPAVITPAIDPSTVVNPKAVAYKLLAHAQESPQQKSYASKRYREELATGEFPAVA